MRDDELMDRLLRDTLAGEPPQLSPQFDDRLMRRVRPRRLSQKGRVLVTAYAVLGASTAAWLMHDLPLSMIVAALVITMPIALGVSAYGRRITAA